MADRVPVERLRVGDVVQAVERGLRGTVVDADRYGWTIVQWPPRSTHGQMPYRHGAERLILVSAASPRKDND